LNNRINKYGLPESDLQSVISIFQKNPKIERAVLLGSRAKGNFSTGSDVDIALEGNELTLSDLLDLNLEIDNLFLPWKFDLIIYNRILEKSLLEHIKRVGIPLFQQVNN
jgi:predicted nucleotidyltransferase